jgi:transposase InsO family protein
VAPRRRDHTRPQPQQARPGRVRLRARRGRRPQPRRLPEIHDDEKAGTCAAFLHRAAKWFHDEHRVTVRRVLTDNAKSYRRGNDWAAVCSALQIKRRFTKPGCPWTNGKAERFNRTLLTEWAYARPWVSTSERAAAFDAFLDRYNTRRRHTALGRRPPISRLAA